MIEFFCVSRKKCLKKFHCQTERERMEKVEKCSKTLTDSCARHDSLFVSQLKTYADVPPHRASDYVMNECVVFQPSDRFIQKIYSPEASYIFYPYITFFFLPIANFSSKLHLQTCACVQNEKIHIYY